MVNGVQNNFLTYNGKEFDNSLNLNTFDLGARQMDPAIGRFMTIDPMADFVNYQSPYAMADNNPIANIDLYGLGKCGALCRAFNKLVFGEKNLNADGTRRSKFSNGTGLPIADKKAKEKSSPTNPTNSSNNSNGIAGPKIEVIGDAFVSNSTISTFAPSNLPKIGLPDSRDKRKLRFNIGGTIATPNRTFEGSIEFRTSSPDIIKNSLNDKTLNDLVKTLKEYPQLKLLIMGNNSFNPGNGKGATLKTPASSFGKFGRLNTTVGGLQLERADAIRKFLIGKGINHKRLEIGNGEIRFTGQKGRTTSFIIKD